MPRYRSRQIETESVNPRLLRRGAVTRQHISRWAVGHDELAPGVDGTTPPSGSEGTVFYEDTAGTVDDRIIEALTDAHVDPSMTVVFTGTVKVQETKYDPGDSMLMVLRDAADAEFPGIANIYIDKLGRFVFHGRYSRFDPDGVSATSAAWDFNRWKAGDKAAITGDATRAQVRVLAYQRARSSMINSAIAWPRGIEETGMAAQVYRDSTAGTTYGRYSWSATDLIIFEGVTAGTYPPHTAVTAGTTQCQKFAQFYVVNTKDPQTDIKTLTIKSVPPGDSRATATWGVLTGADISDVINVSVGYPRGTGLVSKDFYIEGVTMRIEPSGDTRYDLVELDLDVSPVIWSQDTHGVFA